MDSTSNETPAAAGTVGTLPTVVKTGATIALLAALAAILLTLIPVSAKIRDRDSYDPHGTREIACGSVLMPSGDDALADNGTDAPGCASTRVQRAGWAGVSLGGSVVILVFSLLMGDGMAGGPNTQAPQTRRTPE
ncbi:hypothetical protein [Streptomyces sp. NPDC051994]|uniref:hypothetical protein n=1 Tax=unclassified Streptomyces TaxID=2593676 RepID=UPI00341869A3